jgi:hypothetical protein
MNKILMAGLSFLITRFIQGSGTEQGSAELTKLKIATIYLHVVKVSRLFFISLLGSGVCLVLLLAGLLLVHITIFCYAPWDVSVKVTLTLICAFLYILTAIGIFTYVFAEDKWMKMFNAEGMIKDLTGTNV